MKFKDELTGYEYDLDQYIDVQLEQAWKEGGALEFTQRKADNCGRVISNLVQVLASKQVLTKDEISEILDIT